MSRINNTNKDINKAIFSALKESAQAEASRWESAEEPAPRKLTRTEWNKEFGAGADPEVINAGREPEDRVELVEDAPYRRYKVSFYVDTNEMNNMDIEERLNEVLKGSGLASTDETIDVEMIEEFEESSLKEERVNMKLHKGDTFMNDAGVKVVITDVDEEHLLDGEPQVTYYFSNYGVKSPEDYKCFKMSSVVSMLNQNSYKRVD